MKSPVIDTFHKVIPMIYAYTTPHDSSHLGWTKIGYTEAKSVYERIREQTHTADVKPEILWMGNARYNDGSDEPFTDHEFHNYLTKMCNVKRKPSTEWFKISGDLSHKYFYDFTERNFSNLQGKKDNSGLQYELRKEQKNAVKQTICYFKNHKENNEFLWNAKPRFGKTLTTYDLVRKMNLTNVLIITNRPSIANSWFDDYRKFIGWQTKYYFVSETDSLKNKDALTRSNYIDIISKNTEDVGQIAFESLQGLKSSIYFGGENDKLKWIADTKWDLLVIDEAHEGVDTDKTYKVLDNINRKYTLHLTGTPFKALANGKFSDNQIYNWSYADEQDAKKTWNEDVEGESNPYAKMPRLNMYTFQMSEIIDKKVRQGVMVNGNQVNPAFDLNEFFRTNGKHEFVYDSQVDNFLDALTTQEKFPFSDDLRDKLKHTFWILNRVDSAKALAKKLQKHKIFSQYKVILAAGDGSINSDDKENQKAFNRVQEAIKKYDKTITLSVGQLTTGVTVKPWTAVMMLSNMKSPAEYMQAAFRAQNPYTFTDEDGKHQQKTNAYVFDFDPTRTLTIFDEFANNLYTDTAKGQGTQRQREHNIKRLLNFFPVIGEDKDGKMVELDTKQILSIPRHLKSKEVVNSGFMNNFLFKNISNIFNAPSEVKGILENLVPPKEYRVKKGHATVNDVGDVSVGNDGNASVEGNKYIGKARDIFGNKVFEVTNDSNEFDDNHVEKFIKNVADNVDKNVISKIVNGVKKSYGFNKKESNRLQKNKNKEIQAILYKYADKFNDRRKIIRNERKKRLNNVNTAEEIKEVNDDFKSQMKEASESLRRSVNKEVQDQIKSMPVDIIKKVEQAKANEKKQDIEGDARAHLRGFSQTIPSFIMAYGDRKLTLQNFDDYTEDGVFKEVTGISERQFRFLRDGGEYVDKSTGKIKYFKGHLFDEVVFNDSIQEFLNKKDELKDYFHENSDEDIFDYIPPQKTNQIFTPKPVVKHMVDDLEKNNPGIFDDPNKTFADLYMKSGIYITEIVKRLFRSKKMKQIYPDDKDRIVHIMKHQVYGMAPTRIIYLISTNYIFGFSDEIKKDVAGKHFKEKNTAKCAKKGNLAQLVQEEFGDENKKE